MSGPTLLHGGPGEGTGVDVQVRPADGRRRHAQDHVTLTRTTRRDDMKQRTYWHAHMEAFTHFYWDLSHLIYIQATDVFALSWVLVESNVVLLTESASAGLDTSIQRMSRFP